jgi:hypothetical protein
MVILIPSPSLYDHTDISILLNLTSTELQENFSLPYNIIIVSKYFIPKIYYLISLA